MGGFAKPALRLLEAALTVALILGTAWLAWAAALGDRTTAMVVAVCMTCAGCVAVISRLTSDRGATMVAAAAAGLAPALAFATLRSLSEPLMGSAFSSGSAANREGLEAIVIAAALAAMFATMAAFVASRRLQERRISKFLLALFTWAPALGVPVVLGLTSMDALATPSPEQYGMNQPVLGHMEGERTGGPLVVDELSQERSGITLVRVCENAPWCYTLLRRGNTVTTRPGFVNRHAAVHLRYDPRHELYLVESNGALVSTVNANTLASYSVLMPHHVRHSLSPPRGFLVLGAFGVLAALLILLFRRRLTRQREAVDEARFGVAFGDGWGLLADGTTMRLPDHVGRGSVMFAWTKASRLFRAGAGTLTVLRGTREELIEGIARQRHRLDAMQLAVMWTLGTPLLISAAVV